MDGQRFAIRAQVHTIGGYSAHTDQNGLLGFVTRMRHWLSQVRIVHGEAKAKASLSKLSRERYQGVMHDSEIIIVGAAGSEL